MKNNVAYIIAEVRQIDYFYHFLLKQRSDIIIIIINDSDRNVGFEIESDPRLKSFSKIFLSEVIEKNIVFDTVISTGNFKVPIKVYNLKDYFSIIKSVLKFSYARSFGSLFQLSGLSAKFEKVYGRPFDAGGLRRRLSFTTGKYIEKEIGKKAIMYPRGLDINTSSFPTQELISRFDAFMCHGKLDQKVISSKTQKPTYIIGYPRYEIANFDNVKKEQLIKEFNLDTKKLTILWMPSRLDWERPNYQNILDWIDILNEDILNYQLILRPHPHCLQQDPSLLPLLKSYKCRVDTKKGRELGALYQISDLVLCDYGGSMFSATYLTKAVILLNSSNHEKISKTNELDIIKRKKFHQFNLSKKEDLKDILLKLDQQTINTLETKSEKNKFELFGERLDEDDVNLNAIFGVES